jgi:hypothetical protein
MRYPTLSSVFILGLMAGVMSAPESARGIPVFTDDFSTGIDPAKWYLESINGATWVGGDGMANSTPSYDCSNRYLDMLTQQKDFGDFTATWDMLFDNTGFDREFRSVYFRSDADVPIPRPNPQGYLIRIVVDGGYHPNLISFGRSYDGSVEWFADASFNWQLATWYRFELQSIANEFKLKVWDRSGSRPDLWTLEATDPAGMHAAGRFGVGNYFAAQTHVDNVGIEPIPEPGLLLPIGVGLLGAAGFLARRRSSARVRREGHVCSLSM